MIVWAVSIMTIGVNLRKLRSSYESLRILMVIRVVFSLVPYEVKEFIRVIWRG